MNAPISRFNLFLFTAVVLTLAMVFASRKATKAGESLGAVNVQAALNMIELHFATISSFINNKASLR